MALVRVVLLMLFVALVVSVAAAAGAGPRVDLPYAMTVRVLDDSAGKYQVEVDNTNPGRFISSFAWTPPSGMNVTAIDGAIGGRCSIGGDGTINCTGLAAPANSMSGVGSALIVNFTATGRQPLWMNGYWIHFGVVGSVSIQTTVPCRPGEKNTAAHPCVLL